MDKHFQKQPDLRLQVMVSFYNVMEDCVWDLLSHSGDKLTQIRDRMDKSGRVIKSEIVGLTEVECFSANDVSTCLESGQSINLTKSLGDLVSQKHKSPNKACIDQFTFSNTPRDITQCSPSEFDSPDLTVWFLSIEPQMPLSDSSSSSARKRFPIMVSWP